MKQLCFLLLFSPLACNLAVNNSEIKTYERQASRVAIIRDNWGIPHIYGKTDADAVFGLMYAQCEESFERVERAYIEKLGRVSEIEGEGQLVEDLQTRLIYDTAAAIKDYRNSPDWLKALLHAFADGINYYLFKHPGTKPLLINHFEPWYPLLFTDGGYTATQTGGLTTEDIQYLYVPDQKRSFNNSNAKMNQELEPTGSNAFAIAPSKSATKNALLYINPHVSFYFRMEAHMVSEEGLNVYGAVTWGQFFIFQGFNETCGWMHTSSFADAADLYEEKIIQKTEGLFYLYDGLLKKVTTKKHRFGIKGKGERTIEAYYTHHGPVAGMRNGKWLSLKEQNRSLNGLIQSWQLTKAKNITGFEQVMSLRANPSTNTMYADNSGNIAYWHGNFIPKRDPAFAWQLPVNGSIAATEWKGAHPLTEIVTMKNPAAGWMQNCNSTPFSISGFRSISPTAYPLYMVPEGENFRSVLAIRKLDEEALFDLDKLAALGYNHYLSAFDSLLPPLFKAYENLSPSNANHTLLQEPIEELKKWDKQSAVTSVAATLAIEWGYNLIYNGYNTIGSSPADQVKLFTFFSKNISSQNQLDMLAAVVKGLEKIYGTWKVAWGDINRYQRKEGQMHPQFDDNKESFPVSMSSALFGSLPAFETAWNKTKKGYGVAGNSFIAAVEFGKKIKAKAVSAGGQSFDPASKHFLDQAPLFLEGKLRDVYFYKEDVRKHAERTYQPGEN